MIKMWGAGFSLSRDNLAAVRMEREARMELAAVLVTTRRPLNLINAEVDRRTELFEKMAKKTTFSYDGTPKWRAFKSVILDLEWGLL